MIVTSFSILVVPGAVPRYDIILIRKYNTVHCMVHTLVPVEDLLLKNSCLFLHATSCKKRFIFDVATTL